MTAQLTRRSVCLLPLLLAACGSDSDAPTSFPPLDFDYLTKIRLNVATIDVDDSWRSKDPSRDVGGMSPLAPVASLRQMAEERLSAAGSSGRALFVIDDASVTKNRDRYIANFAVHLDVSTSDGTRSGFAEARVNRSRQIGQDDSMNGVRAELYQLVKQMMSDMNVEFEFQVRKSLKGYLQTTEGTAPAPASVQTQDLAPPPGTTAAPSAAGGGPTKLSPGLTPMGATQE